MRLHSGAGMRQLVAMGTIASISKRLGIGAVNILSSLAIISRPIVGSLGDVQAVSGVAGTVTGLLLFLNSLPIEFVVACFSTSLAYLIWSAVQGDLLRIRSISEVKKANTKAWEFEPEFRREMDKLAVDREAFLAAVEEIRTLSMSYHNSLSDVGDGIARRFEERTEKIVRDVFGKHFERLKDERQFEDEKRMREQWQSMQMMIAREVGAVTARLDALTQSPQGTGPETPP